MFQAREKALLLEGGTSVVMGHLLPARMCAVFGKPRGEMRV